MSVDTFEIPGHPSQVREVRRWARDLLSGEAAPVREDVVLLLAEVVTNAIRHSDSGRGGKVGVSVEVHGAAVRCEVSDAGGRGAPRLLERPGVEHGRGLVIVRELAAEWGTRAGEDGNVTWFEVWR
ncbi:ATP-binding protein [Actinocorallia lasiicapitis]